MSMTPKERELLLFVAKRVIPGIRTELGYDLIREIEAEATQPAPGAQPGELLASITERLRPERERIEQEQGATAELMQTRLDDKGSFNCPGCGRPVTFCKCKAVGPCGAQPEHPTEEYKAAAAKAIFDNDYTDLRRLKNQQPTERDQARAREIAFAHASPASCSSSREYLSGLILDAFKAIRQEERRETAQRCAEAVKRVCSHETISFKAELKLLDEIKKAEGV